jgi:alpha-2-macroglobulin
MRALIRVIVVLGVMVGVAAPLLAQTQDLVPGRRLVLTKDTDLPGGDLASLFDTDLQACEQACLSNTRCTAFTFNSRNGSCFPKAGAGEPAPYAGAYSGLVVVADPAVAARAQTRRAELGFLSDGDTRDAVAQAEGLANLHITGPISAAEHMAAAAASEATGRPEIASRFVGAALNLTDSAEGWVEYARLLTEAARPSTNQQRDFRKRAFWASVNGYLRAENPALRHTALVYMGDMLELLGRGRDTVQALRLAQALQPRDDTAQALDQAIGKYGFRITDTDVQSDSARPRICTTFSEDLVKVGVDYTPYVQLPEPGLTVEIEDRRALCIEGVRHGARYSVTFREGLPAADGQKLAKSVDITQYVRDRSASAWFPGRAYVLPRTGHAAIPVETVNTRQLDLSLFRVSDRNILRAIQNEYFGEPMAQYQEDYFRDEVAERLWSGVADVQMEVNQDMTTRLPMDEAIAGLPAGVYALRAMIPGVDTYDVAAAWQWFVISDLGVTTMSGVDGLHVFVRSLGTADAKAGVTVELLSRANSVLATVQTDARGYAHFDAGLTRGRNGSEPALVVVKEADTDLAFLSLTDPEFDLSDRGVEGREPAPPVDVFLTTDRGAYRAGEVVHGTALARDPRAEAIAGLPLTARLKRPDGVEYSRAVVEDNGAGGHVFALPIAGSAPRGVWRLEMFADVDAPALASRTFLVEDFLPERIDFDLTLQDAQVRLGDMPTLDINARYLFGAPGADLVIEGETLLRSAEGLAAFPGYVFGRQDDPFSARLQPFGGDRTDTEGKASLTVLLPDVEDPGRPLEMRVTARVAEGSGRPVERQVIKALTPSAPLVGVKPMFDGVVPEGGEARFALIGVGPDEVAVPMQVKWTVTRVETRYQWYQQYGSWYWEPITTRTRIKEGTSDLGAAPVEVSAPVNWGRYEIAVARIDGPEAITSTTFYAGWFASVDAGTTPDMLELSLDKAAYAPGETATLRIVPRAAGTALVTVLSNRLVAMQAVAVSEGENLISLPVTDEWGAGVYVTATVLRPMDVAAGHIPSRALGLAHAAIDPGKHRLATVVETTAEAAPRGPLDVAVKVEGIAPGETAYATIAAVDLGILNLTGFKSPDPNDHYFGQRKLGIGIRDIYGRLIDGLNGAEGQVRSGGDAGAQAGLKAPPPTEELVAYFSGPVTVGEDGYARASFDLPSFNGTVRVMAVVWSKTGVGRAEADVLVRDPVVVTASVPRFLAPGDESRLLLEVVHAKGPAGRMGLDVVADGLRLNDVPSGFDLAEGGKAVFSLPITAGDAGLGQITVALTTPDGRQLTKTLQVPVQNNGATMARTSRFDLAPGKTFTFSRDVFSDFLPGSAQATIAIGPIARFDAPGLLAALDRYPYGCTEQITSKALPLLYFDQVAQAMRVKGADNIGARVAQAIAEVLTNQSSEGSFGLWAPSSGDLWLDAFVTDFLSRARAQGHAVPDLAFRQALDNLRNQVNYTSDFDAGGQELAYALMVLAREGAAAVGDLRYYADVKGDAFTSPLGAAQLGAALASYGDQTRADAMFARAGRMMDSRTGIDTDRVMRVDYGTNFRDAAAVLALAVEAGSQAVDRAALTERMVQRGGTLSTQEATWALLATKALIDAPGLDGLLIDGQVPSGPSVGVLENEAAAPILVSNGSTQAAIITVTAYGVPMASEPAGGNGYAITRRYYTMEGEPVSLDAVPVGERLVVVLEVQPFGKGEARLMVSDPLPAGFEIDNPNLIRGGDIGAIDWLELDSDVAHSEFRQDRFLTAIDRYSDEAFRLGYLVRAVSPGSFAHPAAMVEDMYRPDMRAWTDAGRVTIVE